MCSLSCVKKSHGNAYRHWDYGYLSNQPNVFWVIQHENGYESDVCIINPFMPVATKQRPDYFEDIRVDLLCAFEFIL